jgi:hypothetical protein
VYSTAWPTATAPSAAVPARPASPQPSAAAPRPAPISRASGGSVHLRYLERSRILVQGPVTGRPYEFSAAQPFQSVDARDASALLRTRFFSQV